MIMITIISLPLTLLSWLRKHRLSWNTNSMTVEVRVDTIKIKVEKLYTPIVIQILLDTK